MTDVVNDDDDDDDDGEEEEEEDDDCSTIAPGESLREPSPSVSLLFEPHSNHLPTLSSENIKLLAQSIISFAPALVYTLTRYRAQLDLWSQQPSASTAVFRASALVNQAFLRALHILEPIWNRCVRRLMDFEIGFKQLDAALDNGTLNLALEAKDPNTLSQLCAMTDNANRIEGSLADLSQQLSEFYDWTDAYLTPALAELNVGPDDPLNATERQEDRRAFQVSSLLDAHSYLCQLMDSLANGVQLFQKSFVELADGCDRLPETLLLEQSSSAHPQQIVRNWVRACCPPLRSMIDCLSVLASLSDSIKAGENGHD
ncbi:hypothetical protein CROQUDRAFT_45114 [Cronartium quercuum f. sp. fusiforme G11]|uniref:Uncharacterized protein n=1 Tax=Cronartium quercuum f. sp. fusiforme G11 TaxID=708437 RepID=A0A9P6NHU7_9BASI|nr:hypothetical protein CROQUDRAFT_45114 [Cronartium quercuum f. sp. fusiforme G11]